MGLWLGDTANKTVVTHLLADLVDRGLSADGGLLVVIDGAKALAGAVRKVFGDHAVIQRCTLHKRRNVTDHLPEAERGWVDRRLARAFTHAHPDAGLRQARDLARQLETCWPDAAASLREGLEEMFTVRRLGVGDRLARNSHVDQPDRDDDLGRPHHHPQREALARRHHDQALGRGRDAQRRTQLPTGEGLQGHAHPRRRSRSSRRSCPTHPRHEEVA